MIKLDRYDAQKLIEARKKINGIAEYNYTSESNPLYRKLCTIVNKIDRALKTELEPELKEEYDLLGRL